MMKSLTHHIIFAAYLMLCFFLVAPNQGIANTVSESYKNNTNNLTVRSIKGISSDFETTRNHNAASVYANTRKTDFYNSPLIPHLSERNVILFLTHIDSTDDRANDEQSQEYNVLTLGGPAFQKNLTDIFNNYNSSYYYRLQSAESPYIKAEISGNTLKVTGQKVGRTAIAIQSADNGSTENVKRLVFTVFPAPRTKKENHNLTLEAQHSTTFSVLNYFTGGAPPLKYHLTGNESASVDAEFKNEKLTIHPNQAGKHRLSVSAVDQNGVSVQTVLNLNITPPLQTINKIQKLDIYDHGTTRMFDLQKWIKGGVAPYQFEISSGKKNNELFDASLKGHQLTLTGNQTGTSSISISVTDKLGATVHKTVDIDIHPALVVNSSDATFELQEKESPGLVQPSHLFAGGFGKLSYQIQSFDKKIITPMLSDTSIVVKSGKPGVSHFTVTARDSLGTKVQRDIAVAVLPEDGNHDHIPDQKQDNVISILDHKAMRILTLSALNPDHKLTINETDSYDRQEQPELPEGISDPLNFLSFQIKNIKPGGSATLTITVPNDIKLNTYWNYGPLPDEKKTHGYEFLYNSSTGAQIEGDKMVLHYIDGQRGDRDLKANGVIETSGAPAFIENNPPTKVEKVFPTNHSVLTIDGKPHDEIRLHWKQANDPDGDRVYYHWQLSMQRNFSGYNMIFDESASDDTTLTVQLKQFDDWFTQHNISYGDTLKVYQRVSSTDKRTITTGAVDSLYLVRGRVEAFTRVQVINNAPSRDALQVYLNNDRSLFDQPLQFRAATHFIKIPADQKISLSLASQDGKNKSQPALSKVFSSETKYILIADGTDHIEFKVLKEPSNQSDDSKYIRAYAFHGVPNGAKDIDMKLVGEDGKPSSEIAQIASGLNYGEVSDAIEFKPAKVLLSAKPGGLYSFDFSDYDPQMLTFVLSPSRGNSFSVMAYDTTGHQIAGQIASPKDEEENELPDKAHLFDNYPNPFNPVTQIKYTIPKDGNVRLKVFNLLGKSIETLVDKRQAAGEHQVSFNGKDLPSSVYIYQLTYNGRTITKKMLLVK